MKSIAIAAALLSGCVNTGNVYTPSGPCYSNNVTYLCVGMESSARFGSCPGCELDAKRLSSLMKDQYGYAGDLLVSGMATKAEVVGLLKKGVESTPEDGLFLFFYSGHGGQEYLGGKEPDGSDREDEFLCLYDTYLLDDEIWDIVSTCKGRVFLYFDACHSATMYRSVAAGLKKTRGARALSYEGDDLVKSKGFTFRPERFVKASPMEASDKASAPRILCWSGCKESEYSYGSNSGGTLTTCVVSNWKKGTTYDELWEKARKDVKKMQETQNPVQTYVGAFPAGTEAFR